MNKKVVTVIKDHFMIIVLVVVYVLFMIGTSGAIFQPMNFNALITQNAYVYILGCGMLMCMLTGGNIDLSCGSFVCLHAAHVPRLSRGQLQAELSRAVSAGLHRTPALLGQAARLWPFIAFQRKASCDLPVILSSP